MSNLQAYKRYEVTGGTISTSYPDNSLVTINDNAVVTFSSLKIGARSTFVVGKFASVTIASTEPVTVGNNSQIILQPGSTLTIKLGSSLILYKSCLLDLSLGKLIMEDTVNSDFKTIEIGSESVLKLGNIPISGPGRISGPKFTEKYEVQEYALLEAPSTFVFDEVDIDGNWHMDKAYPQWFAKTDCDDWSTPINKAIKLKRTGEVFLQRGYYPVKHSIRVTYGIELVGESGIRGNVQKKDGYYYPEDNHGAIVYAVAKEDFSKASVEQFEAKSLVLVNIIQNPEPLLNEVGGKHWLTREMWEKAYPSSTTVVRNITLSNGITRGNMIQQLNGVFAAGGFTLDSVRLFYFKQAVVRSRDYADNIIIRNCKFSGVVNHYDYKKSSDDTSDVSVPDTLWIVHLEGDGDNLEIIGNNFENGIIPNNRTLYVGQNRGGLISCNITGGEIILKDCRGLTFSNNHMETPSLTDEGMLLRVLDSQVTIADNFFTKATEAI